MEYLHNFNIFMKKVRQTQVEARSLKYLTRKSQSHESQRKTEEVSQIGGHTKVI